MLKASSYEYNLSFWVPEDSACQTVLRLLQVTLTAVPGWWKEGSWQLHAIKFTVWTNHGLLHMEICSVLRQKMPGALRPTGWIGAQILWLVPFSVRRNRVWSQGPTESHPGKIASTGQESVDLNSSNNSDRCPVWWFWNSLTTMLWGSPSQTQKSHIDIVANSAAKVSHLGSTTRPVRDWAFSESSSQPSIIQLRYQPEWSRDKPSPLHYLKSW